LLTQCTNIESIFLLISQNLQCEMPNGSMMLELTHSVQDNS